MDTARKLSSCIARSTDINGVDNFLQGCSFSPDGLCVLTYSVGDSLLRLYNSPSVGKANDEPTDSNETSTDGAIRDWTTILSANGGDTVRCYSWYPMMNSQDPASCCFLAASRDQPVQLYDAYSGVVRATYRPFNALDEMESPSVVEFSNDGQKILCGGFRSDRTIHLFDTAMPGRDSTILRLGKTRRSSDGQKGLVSAACFGGQSGGPNKQFFAVGTYSPGSIYIYDYRSGQQATGTILSGLCVVGHGKGHSNKKRRFTGAADCNSSSTAPIADETGGGAKDDINWFSTAKIKWFSSRTQSGVTQLSFAKSDEYTLYSASRRSNAIIAWDLRMLSDNAEYQSNPVRGIGSYETSSNTNQRLEFDIDESGRMLFVGCQDNCVRVYDLAVGKLLATVDDLGEVANGVSHAVVNGRSLLAIATGSRRFLSEDGLEHDDEPSTSIDQLSCLRLNDVSELYPVGPEAES